MRYIFIMLVLSGCASSDLKRFGDAFGSTHAAPIMVSQNYNAHAHANAHADTKNTFQKVVKRSYIDNQVYDESSCLGVSVNGICHGEIINTVATKRCYGEVINGKCTGPLF